MVTVDVRWALPQGQAHSGTSRFAATVVATLSHDDLLQRSEKLTLPDGVEVEIVEVSTVLVKDALTQSVWVAPLR